MKKTFVNKKLYRDLVKKQVHCEMRVLKARIRLAKAKKEYDVRLTEKTEWYGSRPSKKFMRRMGTQVK